MPRLAITMGDPGGVGPEVLIKSLARPGVAAILQPLIFGNMQILRETASRLNLTVQFQAVSSAVRLDAGQDPGVVSVFDPSGIAAEEFSVGTIAKANGRASYAWIVAAAQAALQGEVDGICTAPIAKEALFEAGYTVPGHTELLASQCGREVVRMMLAGGGLRVVLQTIHVSLARVPQLLKTDEIITSLEIIAEFGPRAGIDQPRIAVCGLNPHASEGGHFGNEEETIITPAIEAARQKGIDVQGPFPADTIFHRVLQGDFDFVLAMYHDQGLIPVKTLDFNGGVNVTLGLPLVRTSPDHGTAFNIAGKGIADEGSMVAALKYAASLAKAR